MLVGPLFLFFLPLVQGSACGSDPDVGCSLGVGLLLWLGGTLVGILLATWLLRLGWIFALAYLAGVFAVFRLADSVQNALTLIAALLIPAVASLASIQWSTPWYRSWQSWLAVAASSGVIVWVWAWVAFG